MTPGLRAVLQELRLRQGPIIAISRSDPEVRIGAASGRIWRVEIGGERTPLEVPPSVRDEARAALRENRNLESLGPDSVRAIREAYDRGLLEALRRVDGLNLPASAWEYTAVSAPPRGEVLRGQDVARLCAMLEGDSAMNQATLERARLAISKCIAVAVVDLESGGLLGIEMTRKHPQDFLDLLGAQARELFRGDIVRQIEDYFRRARGLPEGGPPRARTWSAEIDPDGEMPGILHFFRLGSRNDRIYVFVATVDVNYTMFKTQTASAAADLDKQR